MSNLNQVKKFLNYAILLGLVGAAIALAYIFFLPKQYLVAGKIVVIPSGGSASAQKNLGYEVGNTVEIINNFAFKENTFGPVANNFAYAKQAGNSSVINVAFWAKSDETIDVEDAIVRVPASLSEYTRDLYDGSPFKYKMVSDPEISTSPVRPDLGSYLGSGFTIGVLAYILYWFLFDFLRLPTEQKKIIKKVPGREETVPADVEEKKPDIKKAGKGIIEMEKNRPVFKPVRTIEPRSKTGFSEKAAVPENLPLLDELPAPPESEEPTDEEVKERLNRLMRGEL